MTQFTPQYFERVDEEDDRVFYLQPRKVVHIDDGAIAAVGRLFQGWCLPTRCVDLMRWPPIGRRGTTRRPWWFWGLNGGRWGRQTDLHEVVFTSKR